MHSNKNNNLSGFRFIDLFAGVGGFRQALESLGGECVWSCEINKFSRQTYFANYYVNHDFPEDVTKVNPRDIPKYDVLTAGFPCQNFSRLGSVMLNGEGLKGLRGSESSLFYEILRILDETHPQYFILENVESLTWRTHRDDFKLICDSLKMLGYHVKYTVLNSKYWVPQKRKRVFILGSKQEFNLTLPKPNNKLKVLRDVIHPEDGTEYQDGQYTFGKYATVHPKYTISDRMYIKFMGMLDKNIRAGTSVSIVNLDTDQARTLIATYPRNPSACLIPQALKGENPRKITPREMARCMGFPNKFRLICSDHQSYLQLGNSVVIPKVKYLCKNFIS